ncbi:MAG: integration host factor subunit alpha [Nitrospinae bacterium]|nr:integration host factor subunit alpha [Nitrospinota bacterium]
MVKDDIIDIVYERVGFTRNEADAAVEAMFETIKERLTSGEEVNITSFGKFRLRNKKERVGRNPKTGKEYSIKARRVLTFKPSKELREIVNKGS